MVLGFQLGEGGGGGGRGVTSVYSYNRYVMRGAYYSSAKITMKVCYSARKLVTLM